MDVLQREGNVFLTGAAGKGKSFLLSRYLQGKASEDFPVVASTGAAAVLVGGRTFHSFFGLGIMEGGVDAAVLRALRSRKLLRRMQRASCVVIDEVSMLSGVTLWAAERVARLARKKDEPWGGLRVIVVGDFAQLPPVTQGNQLKDWAFLHDAWGASGFQPALLSTVMRTQDLEFLRVLNAVRLGTVDEEVRAYLDAKTGSAADAAEGTRLYPHRASAETYNLRRLEAIGRPEYAFRTLYEGEQGYVESAKRVLPIPEVLTLKEGALVMMRRNDVSGEGRYANGSLGHVAGFTEETLEIRLLTGEDIEVSKEKFTCLNGDGEEVAAAYNFPVTLAWATTIHKAQGASLDRMIVDLHQLWEPGQAYVALSRVRSGAGLTIERWTEGSIRAEPLVTAFYDRLAEESARYVPRPYFAVPERPARETEEDRPKRGATKALRENMIRRMLAERASLRAIAAACRVKEDRILHAFEEMIARGTELPLRYLAESVEGAESIRSAFEEHGIARLKPAFEALGERHSYVDLRVVRCVMLAEEGAGA